MAYFTKGNKIRAISVFRGKTRKQLSKETKISVSTLTYYEKGQLDFVPTFKASLIANALNWPIERLFPFPERREA